MLVDDDMGYVDPCLDGADVVVGFTEGIRDGNNVG
jgi:hypothetical protein